MKTNNLLIAFILITISVMMTSCSVITDIFQAGMGFGIFIVIAVIALIIYLVMRTGKNK